MGFGEWFLKPWVTRNTPNESVPAVVAQKLGGPFPESKCADLPEKRFRAV